MRLRLRERRRAAAKRKAAAEGELLAGGVPSAISFRGLGGEELGLTRARRGAEAILPTFIAGSEL